MENTVVLADGNSYEFSAVGIGRLRRFSEAVKADGADTYDAGAKILHASLVVKHPEVTFEHFLDDLLTYPNYNASFAAFNEANGIATGEAKPEIPQTGE